MASRQPAGRQPDGRQPGGRQPGGGSGPAEIPQLEGLPVRTGTTRSIDAKTIADRFNAGQPTQADYTWPGGRKFFQGDNTP